MGFCVSLSSRMLFPKTRATNDSSSGSLVFTPHPSHLFLPTCYDPHIHSNDQPVYLGWTLEDSEVVGDVEQLPTRTFVLEGSEGLTRIRTRLSRVR